MTKVPKDELILAKLIQNAAALDLYSVKLRLFVDRRGWTAKLADKDKQGCCALGAAMLSRDTHKVIHEVGEEGIIEGNDGHKVKNSFWKDDWFEVGQAFFDARSRS